MDIFTDSPKKVETNSILLRDGRFKTAIAIATIWFAFIVAPITLGTLLGSVILQMLAFFFGFIAAIALIQKNKHEFRVYSADEAHRKVNELYGKE